MKRLALIFVLLCPLPSWAAIAYRSTSHTVCTQTSATAATQTCTLTAATLAGNTVVVGVAVKVPTVTLTSVVGSAATSFFYQTTPLETSADGTSDAVVISICFNCPALTTVQPTVSANSRFVTTVEEYSGVGSIGIYAVAQGNSAAPSVSLTTSDSNNWIVAATSNLGSTGIPTITTGNLRDANRTGTTSSHVAGAACDNTVASPGSVTCTVAITSGQWAAVGVELRSVAAPITNIWPNCTTAPCIIHHYTSTMYGASGSDSLQDIKLHIDPSLAGNLLAVGLSVNPSTITLSTPTDDQSNTWIAGPTTTDSGTTVNSAIFYKCGAATGTSTITFHVSSALTTGNGLQISFLEASGIATSSCIDGTPTGANALTNIIQPGAITTTAANSLLYNYATGGGGFPESDPTLPWVTPDDASSLLSVNPADKVISAMQVVASASSPNPALYTVDPFFRHWNDLAIAFKADSSAGTHPSGITVVRKQGFFYPGGGAANLPFPTSGNAVVGITAYPSTSNAITNFSDGVNTYTYVHPITDQAYYACSSTPSGQHRLTYTSVAGFTDIVLYDIAGAATGGGTPSTACYDTSAAQTGNQTNAGDPITVTNAVTPTTANGLIIAVLEQGTGPPSGVSSPAGVVFDSIFATGLTDSNNYNSGDGYQHFYNPTASAFSYTQTMANSTPSAWESLALAFKAPASGGSAAGFSKRRKLEKLDEK